jgi:predicted site-specific integrase-resolvase
MRRRIEIGTTRFAGLVVNAISASRLAYWLIIAAMAYGLYEAHYAGQTMRAMAEERVQRIIADEDRAFCEKFGFSAGGDAFASCRRELAIIRQNQADRDHADAASLL